MTHSQRTHMRRLLCGIPAFILATALLPTNASAQVRQVDAEGRVTVTTVQRAQGAGVTATSLAPKATVTPESLEDASIRVTGNRLAATATANAATAELVPDTAVPPLWGSRATIYADNVDAEGAILILGRQAITRAPVWAEASRSADQIRAGLVENSQIAIAANSELANARGNDHLASLSSNDSAGGITVLQTADASQVRAVHSGITTLFTGSAADSDLAISDNRQQASAVANSASATLSATGSMPISADGVPTTRVDGTGAVSANATGFVAQAQVVSGPTSAAAGSTTALSGIMLDAGDASGSRLSVTGNSLGASATANDAATTLSVNVSPVTRFGNVAAALTAQRLDGQVVSSTIGRAQVRVARPVAASAVTASGNTVRSSASGNVAGTVLDVDTPMIATGGLHSGPIGTALVSGDETRSTTAAVAAHSDQQIGRVAISASASRNGVMIAAEGPITASSIVTMDNGASALASGNDASTRMSISAPAFASSADLLLSQTSEADVAASISELTDPAGVTIAPSSIADAQLRIGSNTVRTLAIGNRADNALALETAASFDGGGHQLSRAGTLPDGYGASATLALSSVQKVGMLGAQPALSSTANGRFAVAGSDTVSASAITIDGNVQSAGAVANTGDNALTLLGSSLGNTGTALSSSQFGAADVFATSSALIAAPAATLGSTVALTGNVNQGTATVNDVTNRLTVDAAARVDGPITSVGADTLGGAASEGVNVLNTAQFAMGRATATTRTLIAGSIDVSSPGLVDTSFWIEGNRLAAEASGNRAANSVDLHGTSGGIASSQMNTAKVGAATQSDMYLDRPASAQRIEAASVAIDGNRVVALARGNLAENSLTVAHLPNAEVALSQAGSNRTRALAPTAIASNQSNYGGVTATVSGSGFSVPLNGTMTVASDSRFSVGSNSSAATAYANGVVNTVTLAPAGGASGAALVSSQYNYGAVLSRVNGTTPNFTAGDVRGSTLSIANNSVTATATGNVATNLMGTTR